MTIEFEQVSQKLMEIPGVAKVTDLYPENYGIKTNVPGLGECDVITLSVYLPTGPPPDLNVHVGEKMGVAGHFGGAGD